MAKLDQLKCGGCGGEQHRLYATAARGAGFASLTAECVGCQSRSVVKLDAMLTISWDKMANGEDSLGRLCGGWEE